MRCILFALLAFTAATANAAVQLWRFNGVNTALGPVTGIFIYDTVAGGIPDWDITVTGADPLWAPDPRTPDDLIRGLFNKHFQPTGSTADCGGTVCNSATLTSPTKIRFTTGTGPHTLSSLEIVLDGALPLTGGFVPLAGGSFTFFGSEVVDVFPYMPPTIGSTGGGAIFSTSVPEPQIWLVILLSCGFLLATRPRFVKNLRHGR